MLWWKKQDLEKALNRDNYLGEEMLIAIKEAVRKIVKERKGESDELLVSEVASNV